MDWGHEAESALCGFNHEHSAAVVSLPVAPEVVTRNSGAGGDSIVTMAPDMPRCGAISDSNSAVLITKNARSPLSGLPKRTVGAALRGPVLEEKKHGELMRRIVDRGSAIAASIPCRAVITPHHGSPTRLWLKIDELHASLTSRTARRLIIAALRRRWLYC